MLNSKERGENMPRMIKPPEDKQKRALQANIVYLADSRGISVELLKAAARLSDYQYRERQKDPGKYTYDDLLRIAKKLNVTVPQLLGQSINV